MGWQGNGLDVEIERYEGPPTTWLWTLYDRDHKVTTGVATAPWRATLASWWAKTRYRLTR